MENGAIRMCEIQKEINELLEEALEIIKQANLPREYQRAKIYWYAQIISTLSDDSEYLGGSMHSMGKSIQALEEMEDD